MSKPSDKRSYRDTLNLPKTSFAMKANLVQREPASLKRWQAMGLYQRLRQQQHPLGPYWFHDGPPYANGPIHLGHLANKVLKDLVVRSRSMMGYDVPYIPGWDCHGLPIEHKVMQESQGRLDQADAVRIRRECERYVRKYVALQRQGLERLLTLADYEHAYMTIDPAYEADVLDVLAELVGKGLVYRALKPVHWSIENRTALADAELEYHDRQDTSIYVLFELADSSKLPASLNAPQDEAVHLMIWTTTPWTLPANLAVAAGPHLEYGLYRYAQDGQTRHVVMAESLHKAVFDAAGVGNDHKRLGTCMGAELKEAGLACRHPFVDDDKARPVVTATYVTLDDGTGLVHTAPGHGVEDYQTALVDGLDIYSPVQADGTFDDTAPQWLRGVDVWKANELVVEHLRDSGHLFYHHTFTHSYPHDWRSKTPVIFRATEQWFISVDKDVREPARPEPGDSQPEPGRGIARLASLREMALEVTASDIRFLPEWGRNRMRGMLESRPDWCISRQRAWGVPIPAFYSEEGDYLLTAASVRAVAEQFRQHGSEYWFTAEPADLLAGYDAAADPDAPQWISAPSSQGLKSLGTLGLRKAIDTLDVWFESGSSWHACVRRRITPEAVPTDLYCEGSDQHRGWFQVSLLNALGATGQPPFKAVLTHGFLVDKDGRKMSKSEGNTIEVEDLLRDFGADVCRWWVASLNTDNDLKVDMEFFRVAGEQYRKVRNTLRFLLGNLSDFDPAAHRRELTEADAHTVDAWAAQKLDGLIVAVRRAYDDYQFRRAHEALFTFCNDTMSAVYLAAVKDRLYCDRPDGDRRRRTQTVIYDVADALIRLTGPILVHTAEEAYLALHGKTEEDADSVHLESLPEPRGLDADPVWDEVMGLRDRCLKSLEDAKMHQGIDNPLDAAVDVAVPAETYQRLLPYAGELTDLCGVSRFVLDEDGEETIGIEDASHEPRCERSWKRDGTVKQRSDDSMLSDRDAEVLGLA